MGLNLLQIGGDTWNRCGRGWLNIDGAFDAGDAPGLVENVPIADGSGRAVMRFEANARSRLPFANASVLLIYSEHMLEHMSPAAGVNLLSECWRVLAPGGLLRVVTPDLSKYARALVNGDADGFLKRHAGAARPRRAAARHARARAAEAEQRGECAATLGPVVLACGRRPGLTAYLLTYGGLV